MNFKDIHIGQLVQKKVDESGIDSSRICKFMKSTEEEIAEMYNAKSINTFTLLRWSKLLEYDFFRIYSQHLILYAPVINGQKKLPQKSEESRMPHFRKNIYTQEIIDFILEQLKRGEMNKKDVMEKYKIPKTTLYKWIAKHAK